MNLGGEEEIWAGVELEVEAVVVEEEGLLIGKVRVTSVM